MMTPILGAAPVALPMTGPGAQSDAATPGGFGALVAGHLASLAGTTQDAGQPDPGDEAAAETGAEVAGPVDPAATEATGLAAESAEETASQDPVTHEETVSLMTTPVAAVAPVVTPAVHRGPGAEPGSATPDADSAAAASARTSAPDDIVPGRAGAAPATGGTAPATGDPAAVLTTATSGTAPAPEPGAAAAVTGPGSGAATGGAVETAGLTPVAEPGTSPPPLDAPAPAGAPAGPAASRGSALTSQVFPTVPTLLSRGEGTHSITLRLHPADLGEVRITVTVRSGNVDVTLAAGPEAQEALRAGSGELRSLLDLAGSATGQLVVRDLPTSAGPATPGAASSSFQLPTGQSTTDGGAGGRGQGEDASADRRAHRERPGDGTTDLTRPDRPPAHATTTARLDLTL